jgi:hypothetical protein
MNTEKLSSENETSNGILGAVRYSAFLIGQRAIVFDGNSWLHSGDVGNNEKYMLPAKVIKIRKSREYPYEWLADVKFDDGRISKGHFQSGMRHCT